MADSALFIVEGSKPEFYDRSVNVGDLLNYKNIVDKESYPHIKQLNKHDKSLFNMLTRMNLNKAGILIRGDPIDSVKSYFEMGVTEVYDAVVCSMNNRKRIPVLNTSLFIPIDNNPDLIFDNTTDGV